MRFSLSSVFNTIQNTLSSTVNKLVNLIFGFDEENSQRICDEEIYVSSDTSSTCSRITTKLQQYAIGPRPRGRVLIFNEIKFDAPDLASREGTDNDEVSLRLLFETMGFKDEEEIIVLRNKKTLEILSALKSEATEVDHREHDLFICVMLTHGEKGLLYSTNSMFWTPDLWQHFNDVDCPGLKGKPKIFIIQACRGKRLDAGVPVKFTENHDEVADTVDDNDSTFRDKNLSHENSELNKNSENLNFKEQEIWKSRTRQHCAPQMVRARRKSQQQSDISDSAPTDECSYNNVHTCPDILVAYSSPDDFYSFRRPTMGSWFIQTLCQVFNDGYQKYDIMTLLTLVNCRLALDFTSSVSDPSKKKFHQKKQVACFSSTLTKLLYFYPVETHFDKLS